MGDRIVERKPLKKRLNRSKLAILISVLSVIMITGVTLAWFYFQTGEDIDINVGKVELSASIVLKEDLQTVVPGELVVESSSFYKSDDAVSCYVRAVLEYHSESNNLTRDEKNYILALNGYDYSANISTGVDGVSWLSTNDGYYYLVDSEGDFVKVDDNTTYTFASDIILPSVHEVIREGLTIDRQIDGLKLKVKFQAVQSEYLPSNTLDGIIDIFNLCFDESVKDEFLIRFDTNGQYKIAPQVVKMNGKIVMPELTNDEGAVAKWYLDEALTEEFDFENAVKMGYILYVDWVIEEPVFTPGLIMKENAVVGYIGDSTKVIVPASYSLSGERLAIERVSNGLMEFLKNYLEIMNLAELEYNAFPVTMTMAGETATFNNMDEFSELMSSMDMSQMVFPITTTFLIDEVIEGEDFEVTTIGNGSLADLTLMLKLMTDGEMDFPTKCEVNVVVLPEGITTIASGAFAGQTLYSINIPSTVTTIEESAFYQTMIYNISIPTMVSTIADDAFAEAIILECYNNSGINISEKGALAVAMPLTDLNDSIIYTYNTGLYELYFLEMEGELGLCGVSYGSGDSVVIPGEGTNLKHLYSNEVKVLGDYTLVENAFNGIYGLKYIIIDDNVVDVQGNIINNCINLNYALVKDDATANKICAMVDTYVLQNSGYDGKNFVETGIDGLLISDNTTGRKWVKYGNSEDGYSYFKKHELEVSFSQGLTIVDGVVVGYTGSDMQVIIPETYNLVTGKIRLPFMSVGNASMSDLPYPFTLYTNEITYNIANEQEFMLIILNLLESGNYNESVLNTWEIEFFAEVPVDGDDYTVTGIGNDVFDDNENIVSVTIPSTVTTVPTYTPFYENTKLREVINLSSVELPVPDYVTTITDPSQSKIVNQNGYIFYNGGVDNIYLMGYQGDDTELVLPSSFNGNNYKLYHQAFAYTSYNDNMLNVTKITVPSCVTAIGEEAFTGLFNLKEFVYNAPNPIMEETTDFYYYDNIFTNTGYKGFEVTIGANVTNIPAFFFRESNISKINIPENSMLNSIGINSFYDCTLLNSILIPSGVTFIGTGAFYGAVSLIEVINLSELTLVMGSDSNGYVAKYAINILTTNNSKVVDDGDYRYYYGGVGKTMLVKYNGSASQITLPSQINGQSYFIGARAFYGNKSLYNITIPSGVTGIGEYAFYECENLQTITIPETVTSIGEKAFAFCYRVTDIYYNARNIEDMTTCMGIFNNVGSITDSYQQVVEGVNVYIGANVERIPAYMFTTNDGSSDMDDWTHHDVFRIKNLVFAENSICHTISANAFMDDGHFDYESGDYVDYGVTVRCIILPNNISTINVAAFGSNSKSNCYVLCENATVAGVAAASGFTKVYVRDTVTNFSSISFSYVNAGCVDGIYTSGSTEYVRSRLTSTTKYYAKYVAA